MTITTYAQLNVGRNIGTEAMSVERWVMFTEAAASALIDAAAGVPAGARHDMFNHTVQVHYGTGEWDGISEDSAHVSMFWDKGIDIDALERAASFLCREFGQDAIAVVTGSTLVQAEAPAPLPAPVSARRHVANRPALIPTRRRQCSWPSGQHKDVAGQCERCGSVAA